jgi:hypothetical protein
MKNATFQYAQRAFLFLAATALVCGLMGVPARAIVYHGAPNLPLAVSLVVAGGGPRHFSSALLYKNLTGSAEPAETKKLRAEYGDAAMVSAFAIMDFAIDDVLRIYTDAGAKLPPPYPDPRDNASLAKALYAAGISGSGKWDVGWMLEKIMSHPVHHVIMQDLDAKFTHPVNARFHTILAEMMFDVNTLYSATPNPQATAAPAPTPT